MALPKLNAPTHKLMLPSTNEEITFRPFLVKEQKLLMMAQQSEDINEITDTIVKLIKNCTGIEASNIPIFDVEYIFLQLRSKSVGEKIELQIKCPDDDETYVPINLDLKDIGIQSNVEHTTEIKMTDEIKIVMGYPVISHMKQLENVTDDVEGIFSIVKECVNEVHNGDEIIHKIDMTKEELSEFIDSLNTKQFEGLMHFFETMPKLRHIVEVTNPKTKVKSEVLLEGLQSFLG